MRSILPTSVSASVVPPRAAADRSAAWKTSRRTSCSWFVFSKYGAKYAADWRLSENASNLRPRPGCSNASCRAGGQVASGRHL